MPPVGNWLRFARALVGRLGVLRNQALIFIVIITLLQYGVATFWMLCSTLLPQVMGAAVGAEASVVSGVGIWIAISLPATPQQRDWGKAAGGQGGQSSDGSADE
jgi:hypothetical protein